MKEMPDIFYLPEWGKLYEKKENGEADIFLYESENGKMVYPFIKRNANIKIDSNEYYDIVTPYGFNGPLILELNIEKEKFVEEFDNAFQRYCEENNIVAEYIRFSPWFENHLLFEKYYNLRLNKKTIAIDLTVNDILMDEINSKRRNCIRSAMKKDVKIEFDFTGETIEDFYNLYQKTIQKNDIGEYYWLEIDFLKEHFEKLKDHVFIANAIYEDKIVSSSIIVYADKQMHYLYSANDYEYTFTNGNSLLLYEVAEWGKKNNIEKFHLGGASKSEDLMKFKLSFTKSEGYDYYVGSKIRQNDIYNKLVEITNNYDNDFFPKYRKG